MTVYVDDSGWGSLLGGVAIGMYNDANKKFLYQIIDIKHFQGKNFKNQTYLEEALDMFVEMESRIGRYNKIVVCRGFILDRIFDHLEEFSRIHYERAEIGDPLQGLLEKAFNAHLRGLGVPVTGPGAHGMSYDDQVKWALRFKKRAKLAKTGWKCWSKLQSIGWDK